LKQGQVVQSIEVSTIAHATDDLDKVQAALTRLFPDSLRGRQLFTRRYLEGHYGNPIATFEAHLTEARDVDEFKVFFLKQLSAVDKMSIAKDLDRHTDDDGNLYIRIDKQRLFRGSVRLGQDDPIRVRMKFTRFAGKPTHLMIEYLESE
jgi:RNA binding exosome subunit